MMNEEKLLTVARYLEGDMELQEKEGFAVQLEADAELQQLVAEYNNIHQTLKMKIAPSVEDKNVQVTLETLNKQYFNSADLIKDLPAEQRADVPVAKLSIAPYLKWMSIAAVLVIGLLIWAPWSASLYEKYGISKEMSVAERGADQPNSLEKAAALYNAKDYAGARKILQPMYMETPQNTLLAYYFAITLVETGKEAEARTVFLKLYNGESVFKYDAAYYTALSFLKQENEKDARTWLEKIPEGTANYTQAQELISKLK
ncbi:tetratricopeptide repeat protein [Pedobacter frigoris]|uniref:Tetratricopeptide repeat protein n=1 Tax=Pedobacter frigoris TaxID=2571272 RepID=A0A4U1CS23_9SPHI|nr:tetratricopeptide repeat protein [Pedobacter frigoris]TKC08689.1 tetratricopeptide repeat protein [Pedobacter frigoris]